MARQGGFGVQLKITVSATLTAIANLVDVDFPKFKKFIAEATGHGSTGGYYEAIATGKRKLEGFSATLVWDDSESTHAAIVTAFDSDSSVACSIQDPDSTEIIAFSAHIEEIERMSKQEDVYQAKVLFHPTGQPTIT